MMFHVLVRNKVCYAMDTFKESEKKLGTDGGKTQEIHWSFTAFALLLSLSLYFSLQNQLAKHMEKRKQHLS